jgi:glutathione S-transferase
MTAQEHSFPILYSFRRCPYAIRARMSLYYSGITLEHREILLREKPKEFLELSPKGTVPVLKISETELLEESLEIMIWALKQNDPAGWLNADKNTTDALIERNDNLFKKSLDRYKYPNRYPEEDCSNAQNQCKEILQDLNHRLEKTEQLCTNNITLADIAIFPFIRQCAFTDKNWFDTLPIPKLHQWLDNHLKSDLFSTVMVKFDPWEKGDAPLFASL